MAFHESYGEVPTSLLRLLKRNNVPPALFDEFMHAFAGNAGTVETYLRNHPNPTMINYGDVYEGY